MIETCSKSTRNQKKAKRKTIQNETPTKDRITLKQWGNIIHSQNYRCGICGCEFTVKNPPTRDHIIPLTQGGSHTESNIWAVCQQCNSTKGQQTNKGTLKLAYYTKTMAIRTRTIVEGLTDQATLYEIIHTDCGVERPEMCTNEDCVLMCSGICFRCLCKFVTHDENISYDEWIKTLSVISRVKAKAEKEQYKTCNTCHEFKPVSEFYRDASVKDGYKNKCKKCYNEGRK